jgi:hypothetical protein
MDKIFQIIITRGVDAGSLDDIDAVWGEPLQNRER